MAQLTTRPNATLSAGTVTGAASTHAALSDSSDSSFVAGNFRVGFAEAALPAGARVKRYSLRVKAIALSGPNDLTLALSSEFSGGTDTQVTRTLVNWSNPVTATLLTLTTPREGSALDVTAHLGSGVGIYELYLDTAYVAMPTLAVSSPSGTVTATNQPPVTWTTTLDSDGGGQSKYEVRVFTAAVHADGSFDPESSTTVEASGELLGSDSTFIPADLADGTYWIYVRVAQTIAGQDLWSDWDSVSATVDVDRPGAPLADVVGDPALGGNRFELEVQAGDADTFGFEIQRQSDDGQWATVPSIEAAGFIRPDEDGNAVAFDLDARNGIEETYRVRAASVDFTGLGATSSWVEVSGMWQSRSWWIKHPTMPELNLPVTLWSEPGYTRTGRQGIFQPLGSNRAVVVGGTPGFRTGQIAFWLDTKAEQDGLDALLESGSSLLVQAPANHHWPDRWVRFADLDRRRPADKAGIEDRIDSLRWTEVQAPA